MIERIFIRPPAGGDFVELARVEVVAGQGLRGDRYYGADDEPGQNVTFVEAEEIEAFAARHRRELALSATGRNIVTRGVRLNDLVGREFEVGGVRFRGVELCEPCRTLGETLADDALTAAQVVREWLHRAGLRADALTSGELAVGARLRPAGTPGGG